MSDPTNIKFIRVVRTPSSERFLVQDNSKPNIDIAAVDIHYLENQFVTATVVILDKDYIGNAAVNCLIEMIDTQLLPMARLNDGDLSFTVVEGRLIGQFTNEQSAALSNES